MMSFHDLLGRWKNPFRPASALPRRIVLIGIYDLGLRALEALVARQLNVVAVVTKPENDSQAQPMATLARSLGKPVLAPESPSDRSFIAQIRKFRPDLIAVAGYHKLLPPELLALPSQGVLNLHGSLLPQYRGPCPWKWAIAEGQSRSGATVHQMSPELDRGDILAQRELDILEDDTGESLFLRISAMGSALLADTIADLKNRTATRVKQDEGQATYQGNPKEDTLRIRWDAEAPRIRNLIRGFSPRPGAWTRHQGARLRIRGADLAPDTGSGRPGMILNCAEDRVLVATGNGNLWIGKIEKEGSPEAPRLMTLSTFELGR